MIEHRATQKYLDSAQERITMLEMENARLKKELDSFKANVYPLSRPSVKE